MNWTAEQTGSLKQKLQEYKTPFWFSNNKILTTPPQSGEDFAFVPAIKPEKLGSESFCKEHNVKLAYVAGAMATGITSEEMVIAMAKAGMLSFFGAAGLGIERTEKAIQRIQEALTTETYGFNLIHSPFESWLEEQTDDNANSLMSEQRQGDKHQG